MAMTGRLRSLLLRWPGLVALAIAANALAGLGALIAGVPDAWYAALTKPAWNPPDGLFGPVWTVLYTTQATSVWLLLRADHAGRMRAIQLFAAQFLLNILWAPVFFGLHTLTGALALILAIDVALVAAALAAWPVNRLAALLYLPYAGWTLFATALTAHIWNAN